MYDFPIGKAALGSSNVGVSVPLTCSGYLRTPNIQSYCRQRNIVALHIHWHIIVLPQIPSSLKLKPRCRHRTPRYRVKALPEHFAHLPEIYDPCVSLPDSLPLRCLHGKRALLRRLHRLQAEKCGYVQSDESNDLMRQSSSLREARWAGYQGTEVNRWCLNSSSRVPSTRTRPKRFPGSRKRCGGSGWAFGSARCGREDGGSKSTRVSAAHSLDY